MGVRGEPPVHRAIPPPRRIRYHGSVPGLDMIDMAPAPGLGLKRLGREAIGGAGAVAATFANTCVYNGPAGRLFRLPARFRRRRFRAAKNLVACIS